MAIFALTSENIDFTKDALRTEYRNAKSSHLSEALARGLRFQTHAALLACLRSNRFVTPAVLDIDAFQARLLEFGVTSMACGLLTEAARSTYLPQPLWREFDRVQTTDPWFYDCKDRNIPFITMVRRTKYARVEWDCISTNGEYDNAIRFAPNDRRIMHEMYDFFCDMLKASSTRNKALFHGGAFVGHAENLELGQARDFADGIALILHRAMRSSLVEDN